MTIVAFDLDLTTICGEFDLDILHDNYKKELSKLMQVGIQGYSKYPTYIINPSELVKVFNSISEDPENKIMFLTAGAWIKSDVIELFCTRLKDYGLSDKAEAKLREAFFHSSYTDLQYFPGKTVKEISAIPKDKRLDAIFTNNIKLFTDNIKFAKAQCVLLDDNKDHIRACQNSSYIWPVEAPTGPAEDGKKLFYPKLIETVAVARKKEQRDQEIYTRLINNMFAPKQQGIPATSARTPPPPPPDPSANNSGAPVNMHI